MISFSIILDKKIKLGNMNKMIGEHLKLSITRETKDLIVMIDSEDTCIVQVRNNHLKFIISSDILEEQTKQIEDIIIFINEIFKDEKISISTDSKGFRFPSELLKVKKAIILNLIEETTLPMPEIKDGLYTFGMYLYCNKGISLKKAQDKDYQMVAFDFVGDEYKLFCKECGYSIDSVGMWYEGSLKKLFK